MFDDQKFEKLDWVSQITETIESDLNRLLMELPDKIDIAYETIENAFASSGGHTTWFHVEQIIVPALDAKTIMAGDPPLTWDERKAICECFNLEWSPGFTIDLATKTMQGTISAVKHTQTLSDEKLQSLMGSRTMIALSTLMHNRCDQKRLNEILDLLGQCQGAIWSRSPHVKARAISTRLHTILTQNEWRIRDTTLANKIGDWIVGYVMLGNLDDFARFCKLKVMTHHNMPIYSVEEQ